MEDPAIRNDRLVMLDMQRNVGNVI